MTIVYSWVLDRGLLLLLMRGYGAAHAHHDTRLRSCACALAGLPRIYLPIPPLEVGIYVCADRVSATMMVGSVVARL